MYAYPDQSAWYVQHLAPCVQSLRAYLRAKYPTIEDVDDLVQECLHRVLRSREQEEIANPRGLLFAIARNLALDAVRRQRVVSFEPITENPHSNVYLGDDDVVATVCKNQELELLREAIAALPARCRQVVTLRTAYALSQKEIARHLGIGENTVEKQLAKGFQRCAQFLAERGL